MKSGAKKHREQETISTHEMRFQFERVLRAVKSGRTMTLTYRNKPLARIVPFGSEGVANGADPIFKLHECAERISPLSNKDIDAAIYGA
jgi:antitoxin (DNA-binding transcriptional repressor) of toxin-antitoxin stability system